MQSTKKPRRMWLGHLVLTTALLLIIVTSVLPAFAQAPAVAIAVRLTDSSFDGMPDALATGIVSMTFVNEGREPHVAQIVKLRNGVTMRQFDAAMHNDTPEGEVYFFSLVRSIGTTRTLPPGASERMVLSLDSGRYVMLDHHHADNGMLRQFEVTGSPAFAR